MPPEPSQPGERPRAEPTPDRRSPKLALAMLPGLENVLLDEPRWQRLGRTAELLDRRPIHRTDSPRARELLSQAEVLLTCWGCPPLTGVLDDAPHLRLVAHAAGTVRDFLDESAFTRGLVVTSAAEANAVPVAEYTVAAILFAGKGLFIAREEYRRTREPPMALPLGVGNYGRAVGLVGASRVGRLVIERLRSHDLELLVHDPYLDAVDAAALGVEVVGLDELCERSEVLSLHAPENPSTRAMMGAAQLAALRDGAVVVNTARGALIDAAALEAELVSGRLSAVLDVTDPPTLDPSSPLFDLPNVFLTPHVAGSQGNELHRLADSAISEVERLAEGRSPMHPVDLEGFRLMSPSAFG